MNDSVRIIERAIAHRNDPLQLELCKEHYEEQTPENTGKKWGY